MKKQLIIICDMEGASGIFDDHIEALYHGSKAWREYGRSYLTSDVLAVCDAANKFGIDEILIYDGHYAGDKEPNLLIDQLPENVKLFDTYNRCFDWRRIRGQAELNPFGIITVGQHARLGEPNAYFPHTIQSPPIKEVQVNGIHIAEIGFAALNFMDVRYLANIGCQASMKEAKEMSETVVEIPVKDKLINYEPTPNETYPIIKEKVLKALKNHDTLERISLEGPYKFSMSLVEGFKFDIPNEFSWKGSFTEDTAYWEAPDVEMGIELFNYVRAYIKNV